MADSFVQKFKQLTMQRNFTFRTREATPPTWGQMKRLTQEAEKTLMKAGQPLKPTNLLLADTPITWHVTTAIMASKRLVGFRGCPAFINVFSASWVNFFIWPHVGGVASLVQEVRLLCIVSSLNFWTRGSAIVDFDQSRWGPKPVIINRNESIPSSQIY